MAITSGAALWEYGTQTTVITEAAGSANLSFSGTPTTYTQTDYCPLADVTLDITYTTAPPVGSVINLYRRDMNIDGTNDAVVPSANHLHTYAGTFQLSPTTGRQYHQLTDIPLTVSQDFYIEFRATYATATNATTVKVTPKSFNAKA